MAYQQAYPQRQLPLRHTFNVILYWRLVLIYDLDSVKVALELSNP